MEARDDAMRVLAEARAKADAMIAEARISVAQIARNAAAEARDEERARVAVELVSMRLSEEKRAERELDRTVEVAKALAERLVGDALRIEPERIAALATEALHETRGARRVRIEACPEDAAALSSLVSQLGLDVAEVVPTPELGRGSLVVQTDLGRVDARLAPLLARLSEAVREALR